MFLIMDIYCVSICTLTTDLYRKKQLLPTIAQKDDSEKAESTKCQIVKAQDGVDPRTQCR